MDCRTDHKTGQRTDRGKKTLSEQTAARLRDLIVDQAVYPSGAKLPNENELSEQLGISRTTLREAIHILVSEGILTVKRGRGTYVVDNLNRYVEMESDLGQGLQNLTDMRVTLRDLYETRMIFEPAAAELACKRATDEEIGEILRLGQECQYHVRHHPAGPERIVSESAFHGAILKASHNDFLSRFMPILTETLEKTFAMNFNLDVVAEDAYKDHIMIMEFLKRRDAEGLKSAVTIHLRHAVWNEELQ